MLCRLHGCLVLEKLIIGINWNWNLIGGFGELTWAILVAFVRHSALVWPYHWQNCNEGVYHDIHHDLSVSLQKPWEKYLNSEQNAIKDRHVRQTCWEETVHEGACSGASERRERCDGCWRKTVLIIVGIGGKRSSVTKQRGGNLPQYVSSYFERQRWEAMCSAFWLSRMGCIWDFIF